MCVSADNDPVPPTNTHHYYDDNPPSTNTLPPHRVHSHAAAALINFCEGVARDTLLPYLDPIVERLLKLLNPPGDPALVRRYVQEQAITTLAMVADASEVTFAKVRRVPCGIGTGLMYVWGVALPVDYAAVAECVEECGGA